MAPQSSCPVRFHFVDALAFSSDILRTCNQGLPGEIRRLDGESRLAQEHGMASHEGIRIDPVWASQEEKKHSTQPGCFVNAVRNETSNDDNVKGLHRLRCLRGLPYMNQGVSVYPQS